MPVDSPFQFREIDDAFRKLKSQDPRFRKFDLNEFATGLNTLTNSDAFDAAT